MLTPPRGEASKDEVDVNRDSLRKDFRRMPSFVKGFKSAGTPENAQTKSGRERVPATAKTILQKATGTIRSP